MDAAGKVPCCRSSSAFGTKSPWRKLTATIDWPFATPISRVVVPSSSTPATPVDGSTGFQVDGTDTDRFGPFARLFSTSNPKIGRSPRPGLGTCCPSRP